MNSKVIIIDDEINYIGDINDDKLHVMWLKDYGNSIYGLESGFSKIDNASSPNLGVLEFIKKGNIVILNLSRFEDKYALMYFPHNITNKQKDLLIDVLNQLEGFDVLSDFCMKDVDEKLIGEMINDSYDDGFYETLEYLDNIVQKNKGF